MLFETTHYRFEIMTEAANGRKSITTHSIEPVRGRPRSEAADNAIITSTLRLLVTQGLAGTTMAGIARDAGVSTATLYRRYATRNDVVIAALTSDAQTQTFPDTGSLEGDLRGYLRALSDRLTDERGARILTALLDESSRDESLAEALYTNVSVPGRRGVAIMFERAIERGEMRADIDIELAVDLAVGPLYHRRLEPMRPIDPALPDRLCDLVLLAVQPQLTPGLTQ